MDPDAVALVVELAEALDDCQTELAQLKEIDLPVPDKIVTLHKEHYGMKRALAAAPADVREHLVSAYREEVEKAPTPYDEEYGGSVPVQPEPLQRAAAAFERIRVAGLLDRDLHDGMRGAVLRSDWPEWC